MSCTGVILIIEDNQLNLDMARDLLELAGFGVLEAEDADKGIRLAKERRPDLILMDIHLPVKNGYETSKILKADPQTRDIPIIGFTALAMEEDIKRALAHGCAGVISKPINVDTFSEQVAAFLTPDKRSALPSRTVTGDKSSNRDAAFPFDQSRGTVLIVDDQAQNVQLLEDVLCNINQHSISASNGRKALQLAREEKPSLVLLDIMMPEMDGYEVFTALKSDPETAQIPVIFVSALSKNEEIAKGMDHGAVDYITKPFQVEDVQARVTAALQAK